MADHRKALPARGESSSAAPLDPTPLDSAPLCAVPLQPVDFDGTLTLPEATLRAIARDSTAPGARLAAAWRLMMRGQALPTGAPGEGLRGLTLLNLATQQDLEILEVLVCLDPAPSVRAQASLLLWRVARDRDRVVDRLVAQLGSDEAPDVVNQLLSLVPSLPFEKTRSLALAYLCHPSLDVRRASWNYWFENGGSMESAVTALIWREPSRELHAWCLSRWANDASHADMLRDVEKHPEAKGAVVEAISRAGRVFPLTAMSTLLHHSHLDTVLRIARRPFDVADRRILVSLTGLTAFESGRGRPRLAWIGDALWRCLHEAYSSQDASTLTGEEKTWVAILEEEIAAPAAAPTDESEGEDYEDYEDPSDGREDMRRLLRVLTSAIDQPTTR
jgi:hypothetical protein